MDGPDLLHTSTIIIRSIVLKRELKTINIDTMKSIENQSCNNAPSLHRNVVFSEDKVRTILNKVTMKTIDLHSREMLRCVAQVMMNSGDDGELRELLKLILNICSANRGYNADVYAAVIKRVVIMVPSSRDYLIEYVGCYKSDMDSLNHASPRSYNQFCECVTSKELRKGSLVMIKSLEACDGLSLDVIMDILVFLVEKIQGWCGVREKSSEIDELVDHLYLLTSEGNIGKICEQPVWGRELFPKVLSLSRLRATSHGNCSISMRAHFRLKDIVKMQAILAMERAAKARG